MTSAGTVIAGGVVSTTVTLKLALAELPLIGRRNRQTVAPSAKIEPDAWLTVTVGDASRRR